MEVRIKLHLFHMLYNKETIKKTTFIPFSETKHINNNLLRQQVIHYQEKSKLTKIPNSEENSKRKVRIQMAKSKLKHIKRIRVSAFKKYRYQ